MGSWLSTEEKLPEWASRTEGRNVIWKITVPFIEVKYIQQMKRFLTLDESEKRVLSHAMTTIAKTIQSDPDILYNAKVHIILETSNIELMLLSDIHGIKAEKDNTKHEMVDIPEMEIEYPLLVSRMAMLSPERRISKQNISATEAACQ
ncbi:hypothetical protein ScPMuIL_013275 [Solemya velum]